MNKLKNILKLSSAYILKNKPVYLHFGITHRCNLRCRMCTVYEDTKEAEELSFEQIEIIFDKLKRLGIVYVSIGGGEPFLRKDLCLIVKLLIKKDFNVRLLTNCVLADEQSIKELAASGLREVSVSLDTLEHDKFSYICNNGNIREKVMQNIRLFSDILPQKNRLLLINTVVSPLNINELPQLARFAQKAGYCISFIPAEANAQPEFIFKPDDYHSIDESYDYLLNIKKRSLRPIFNSSAFLKKSKQYLKSEDYKWSCHAGKLYFSLSPKGELSICHKFKSGVSLLDNSAENYFASKEFKEKREGLVNGCCGCMRPCWAEISSLFNCAASLYQMCRIKF